MSRFLERRPLCLTPLSPIHVGSGDELDWTSAVLDDDRLAPFDPLAVQLQRNALDALDRAASVEDAGRAILQLQQVFRQNRGAFVAAARGAPLLLPPAIAQEFGDKIGRNVQEASPRNSIANQLSIARMITSPATGRPLIPGSSVKGMLRTAEVARLDDYRGPPGQPRDRDDGADIDRRFAGQFQDSPFSKLSLSDLTPTDAQRSIVVVARNVRRKPKASDPGSKGVTVRVEAAMPFVAGGFRGDVRILGPRGARDEVPSFDVGSLLATTHDFHRGLFAFFRREIEQDRDRAHMKDWLESVTALAAGVVEGRAALVRIGKFCSAESKTVAHRCVRIPQAKTGNSHVLHPYTIWLADPGRPSRPLPFGWALLELAEEPGAAVSEFCARMAGGWDFGRAEPPSPPVRRDFALTPLAQLEEEHDSGRDFDRMLENYIRQSQRWSREDRLLLARLVRDKLRARSKLPAFRWRQLEPMLLKLPD